MTITNTERFDSLSSQVPFAQRGVRTGVYTVDFSASQSYVVGGQTIDVSADFSSITGCVASLSDTGNTLTDFVPKVVSLVPAAVCVVLHRNYSGIELTSSVAIPNSTKVTLLLTGVPVTTA